MTYRPTMELRHVAAISLLTATLTGGWVFSAVTNQVGATSQPAAGLITVTPSRVLNTRNSSKLRAGGEVVVNTGITGAVAVVVNITITDAEGDGGYVTAWSGGPRPDTSIINAGAGMTLANAAIITVAADGTFRLYTYQPANLLVDLSGYFPGSAPVVQPGVNAVITGYGPLSTITQVTGTVTNGSAAERNVRIDVQCPNGTVATDTKFALPPGETRGWSALCTGNFTSGATVTVVQV